jgi:hypothetical protein
MTTAAPSEKLFSAFEIQEGAFRDGLRFSDDTLPNCESNFYLFELLLDIFINFSMIPFLAKDRSEIKHYLL